MNYNLKILAVDDETGMRNGMEKTLSRYKIKLPELEGEASLDVTTAESAEEAYDLIKSSPPDLLVLDYKMPGMSGLELLEKLGPGDGSMLTIMITAYASLETAISAIKSGAFDFLAKPFTPGELREKVTKAAQNLLMARQVKKLAEERKKVRFQFISVLGHELKAPLNAIEGYIKMMEDRISGDKIEDYDQMLDRCLVRTDQMKKLILDLLELTKIESGERQRHLAELNICEMAKMSVETMLPDAGERGIKIELNCDGDLKFTCDRDELEIILNNLVSNAVKYNRDNGEVSVKIYKNAEDLVIKVKDTGIGMTKEETAMLFKEFSRIRNKQTKNIQGSGLGLSTVKKIIQLYNGDIKVDSVPGGGTGFRVVLKSITN